jgi:hypothetical protein
LRMQPGQMDRDNLPDAFKVYSQIIVDENIPESGYGAPVDLRMPNLEIIADSFGGFGKGLKIAQDSILNQFRAEESFPTILAVPLNAFEAIKNVMDVESVVPHKGIAS